MATVFFHIIGSITYLVGIVLLTNTVIRIYVNEVLHRDGTTTKARIIRRFKEPLCGINRIQHHYITIQFIVESAQSLICGVTFKVTAKTFGDNILNDFLDIIYSKHDDKFYHNIKQRMVNELKPISLYLNILLSMFIMSLYPLIYFLSSPYTLFILSFGIILCVLFVPHHLRCDYYQNNTYCIKRMANTKDLAAFNINDGVETDTDVSSSINENNIYCDPQITSNMTDNDDVLEENEENEIVDQPQEAVAILYESYMVTPEQEMDDKNEYQDDYIMVFN